MTEAELAAIEARAEAVKAVPDVHRHAQDEEDWISAIDASSSDVPALVAEVRRLRSVITAERQAAVELVGTSWVESGEGREATDRAVSELQRFFAMRANP